MNIPTIELGANNIRLTQTRKRLISALSLEQVPLSVPDIMDWFVKNSHSVHKTTLYRDLLLFETAGMIRQIDFGDGTKRYEPVNSGHHHHLICENCQSVTDVSLPNDMVEQERQINATHQFKINRHSLEFFGLCHNCQII